uniref:Uncharacterized protein n=1 Tax=Rhodnius prolixus TaxID=13249 RepID=T1HTB6_RHOPR
MGGIYIFQIFDYYGASGMVLLWFCFFESIVVAHFYGVDLFCHNIKEMVGYMIHGWFRICWLWLTPICTLGILIFSTIQALPLTYNRTYFYPNWALNTGRTLALVPMAVIPVYFVLYLLTRQGTLKDVSERFLIELDNPNPNTTFKKTMERSEKADIAEQARQLVELALNIYLSLNIYFVGVYVEPLYE